MSWTCPNCSRVFRKQNQTHSCAGGDLGSQLENRAAHVKEAFEKLLQMLPAVGIFTINPLKSAIQFKNPVTFLSVQFKKDQLMLEFYLPQNSTDQRIVRTLPLSRNRIVHYYPVQTEKDIHIDLLNWIQQSYDLVQ